MTMGWVVNSERDSELGSTLRREVGGKQCQVDASLTGRVSKTSSHMG